MHGIVEQWNGYRLFKMRPFEWSATLNSEHRYGRRPHALFFLVSSVLCIFHYASFCIQFLCLFQFRWHLLSSKNLFFIWSNSSNYRTVQLLGFFFTSFRHIYYIKCDEVLTFFFSHLHLNHLLLKTKPMFPAWLRYIFKNNQSFLFCFVCSVAPFCHSPCCAHFRVHSSHCVFCFVFFLLFDENSICSLCYWFYVQYIFIGNAF